MQKQLTSLLLLLVLFCLCSSATTAQKSERKTRKPATPRIVCTVASVPKGMVVVGYKRNSACSGGTELFVKQPEDGDIICAESPVPQQFSIVSEAQGNLVGTCPTKAFLHLGKRIRIGIGACGIACRQRPHRTRVCESNKLRASGGRGHSHSSFAGRHGWFASPAIHHRTRIRTDTVAGP